ncbi:alkaline phosphatase family protein [Thalassotalea marina]|uniref:Type I phosphodiesterase/nucleotide pyrophosphatase n=1 Tax=Thalassotalea marina TaxID=1673741 RepID=A0A919ENU6_9GAMM|nr:alkaline phosphatase family protein [Thalassotalea marina]GHG06044.1 hypothetical protein GCM10017161_39570 [Thalassotalea marina]
MFNKKNFHLSLATLCSISALALSGCNDNGKKAIVVDQTPPPVADAPTKKVLIIGIDGLMYDYIDDIDTPELNEPTLLHFPRLTLSKALTGGYIGTQSHQVSSSGPAWSSILTGTWIDGHTIASNNNQPAATTTIFEHLYNADNNIDMASFAAWTPINAGHAKHGMQAVKQRVDGNTRPENVSVDDFITDKLVQELMDDDSNLDFIFTHLDEVDGAGHACGWCVPYEETLKETDVRLGKILDAIENRESKFNEQWLVMIVSDHGHVKTGGHGGDSIAERTSVIGTNKPDQMNALFGQSTAAFDLASEEQNKLMGYPGITSIVPTVLNYLGQKFDQSHQFSSPALIGEFGITHSYTQVEQSQSSTAIVSVHWFADSSIDKITLLRDGQEIAQVSAADGVFKDELSINTLGAGNHKVAYSLVATKGSNLTSWATVSLGEDVAIDTVLASVTSHVTFDNSITPFEFIAGSEPSAVFEAGPFNTGNAVRLNREKGYLTMPLSFEDKLQGAIGFWLKVNGNITSDPNIIANKDWNSGGNPGFTIAATNSSLKFNVGDGSGRADAALSYSRDNWIFVIASFDLTQGEIALYINDPNFGFQEAKVAAPDVSSLATSFPLNLAEGGDGQYNLNKALDFSVADLLFFNRALKSNEARALANMSKRVELP